MWKSPYENHNITIGRKVVVIDPSKSHCNCCLTGQGLRIIVKSGEIYKVFQMCLLMFMMAMCGNLSVSRINGTFLNHVIMQLCSIWTGSNPSSTSVATQLEQFI